MAGLDRQAVTHIGCPAVSESLERSSRVEEEDEDMAAIGRA